MHRQQSISSFMTRPPKQTPCPETPQNNMAAKQSSYTDMLNRRDQMHLQFSQFKHKFSPPKESSSAVDGKISVSTEVDGAKTPSRKHENSLSATNRIAIDESLASIQRRSPTLNIKRKFATSKMPLSSLNENTATPNHPTGTGKRPHASNISGSTFNDRLNSAMNDATLDACGPDTPAMRPLVPRIKRVHEDDSDINRMGNVFPASDPNKRRKLIEALGEDGLVQGGALEKAKTKFEWLEPSVIRDAKRRRPSDPFYDRRTLHVPADDLKKMSASQKQYWATKSQYMDTVLFFKVGKFYELYELDAEIGHREFDWKMTISGVGKCRQVGVPESGIEDAVQKLMARGYKVGRMEQIESAQDAKAKRGSGATIERKLVHVSTPSTTMDDNLKPEAVHLLALKEESFSKENDGSIAYGFAFVDAAACQFFVGSISDDSSCSALGALLVQVSPQELLFEIGGLSKETQKTLKKYSTLGCTALELTALQPALDFMDASNVVELIQSKGYLNGSENASWFAALGSIMHKELATSALGALVSHLRRMKLDDDLLQNGTLNSYEVYKGSLRLDGQTLSNLEIFNNNADGGKAGTLFKHLDNCITPFGKRLLRRWICHPLRSIDEINYRLDAVEEFISRTEMARLITEKLRKLPDIERLTARVKGSSGSSSVVLLPFVGSRILKRRVKTCYDAVKGLRGGIDLLKFLHARDHEGPPKSRLLQEASRLENMSEVDELLNQMELILTNKSSFDMQSQMQGDDLSGDVSEALNSFVSVFRQHTTHWSHIVDAISRIDVLLAFAVAANSSNGSTCRPFFVSPQVEANCSGGRKGASVFSAKGLWHPYAIGGQGGLCVANDVELGKEGIPSCPHSMLLTGPNMGGKSTLLRATCLSVIMAQLGCYVACESCILSPADIIFTRLGASDRIIAGESTFLVECMEAASVLRYATQHSIVVLDELGRGTSTFDGYAIAYAVFRHLVEEIDCRLLFATHYHPLTKEFAAHPSVSLKHMACTFEPNPSFVTRRKGDSCNLILKRMASADINQPSQDLFEAERQLVFLYKLMSGASPESYGLQVALLAGMPKSVVKEAFDASQVMKSWLSSTFESTEWRAEFSTMHEQWLKILLATPDEKSFCDSLDLTTEDAYDTLLCVWHELRKHSSQFL